MSCRTLYRGAVTRYDIGRWRLPECLCLVSRRPFFGMFNSVLAAGQALRLLQQAVPSGVDSPAVDCAAARVAGGGDALEQNKRFPFSHAAHAVARELYYPDVGQTVGCCCNCCWCEEAPSPVFFCSSTLSRFFLLWRMIITMVLP